MNNCSRRHEKRRVCVLNRLGQCLQVWQKYTGGCAKSQFWDFEFLEDVGGGVLPKHHVAVTSGVIDYNFRGTNFGDDFLEGSGQAGWVGHVCGLSVYGCGWSGGGGGVE